MKQLVVAFDCLANFFLGHGSGNLHFTTPTWRATHCLPRCHLGQPKAAGSCELKRERGMEVGRHSGLGSAGVLFKWTKTGSNLVSDFRGFG